MYQWSVVSVVEQSFHDYLLASCQYIIPIICLSVFVHCLNFKKIQEPRVRIFLDNYKL